MLGWNEFLKILITFKGICLSYQLNSRWLAVLLLTGTKLSFFIVELFEFCSVIKPAWDMFRVNDLKLKVGWLITEIACQSTLCDDVNGILELCGYILDTKYVFPLL